MKNIWRRIIWIVLGIIIVFGVLLALLVREVPRLLSQSAWLSREISLRLGVPVVVKGSHWNWRHTEAEVGIGELIVYADTAKKLPALALKNVSLQFNFFHMLQRWHIDVDQLSWDSFVAHAMIDKERHLQLGYPGNPVRIAGAHSPSNLSSWYLIFKDADINLSASTMYIAAAGQEQVQLNMPSLKMDWPRLKPLVVHWGLGKLPARQLIEMQQTRSSVKDSSAGTINVHLQLQRLNMQHVLNLLFVGNKSFHVQSSEIDGDLNLRHEHDKWLGGLSGFNWQTVFSQSPTKRQSLKIVNASAQIQGGSDRWSIVFNWPELLLDKQVMKNQTMRLKIAPDSKSRMLRYQLVMDKLRLQEWLRWGESLLPVKSDKLLQEMRPRVTLAQLEVSVVPQRSWLPQIDANVADVELTSSSKTPGVHNFSGQIHVDLEKDMGALKLNTEHATLHWPAVFPGDWQKVSLHGAVDLRKVATGWVLKLDRIDYHDIDADMVVGGRVDLGKGFANPVMHLQTKYSMRNLPQLKNYLPFQMKKHTRDWLARSFLAGSSLNGSMRWDGPILGFPYQHNEGSWLLIAPIKNLKMKFNPKWPDLDKGNGILQMKNTRISFSVPSADLMGNHIDHASGYIPTVIKPILHVTGHVATQLQTAIAFLRETPLKWAEYLKEVVLTGPVDLQIKLFVDLKQHPPKIHVDGDIRLQGSQVDVPTWKVTAKNAKGLLHFTERGISGKNVHANVFGSPAVIGLKTTTLSQHQTNLQVGIDGQISIPELAKEMPFALLSRFHGKTKYQAQLNYAGKTHPEMNHFVLNADLVGVQVDLPAPFTKAKKQAESTRLYMTLTDHEPFTLRVDYNHLLSAWLVLQKDGEHTRFRSGNIILGGGVSKKPTGSGLVMQANFNTIDAKLWMPVLAVFYKTPQGVDLVGEEHQIFWRAIDLRLRDLRWGPTSYGPMQINLNPTSKYWAIDAKTEFGNGLLEIPNNKSDTWRVKLRRFAWNKLPLKKLKDSMHITAKSAKGLSFPNISVQCELCTYEHTQLGNMDFLLSNRANSIKSLWIYWTYPTMKSRIKLRWGGLAKNPKTYLEADTQFTDLGATIKRWVNQDYVLHGYGSLKLYADWAGEPTDFSLSAEHGALDFKFRDIQFIKLPKKMRASLGLGKLISVLSLDMHSLPILNLTERGLLVNTLTADWRINGGLFATKNLRMTSSIMNAQANGWVNVLKKTTRLNLAVQPQVTGSLPLIAAISGGPVVGIFAFILNKFLEPIIGKAAQLNYQISGPWDALKVQKLRHAVH